MRRTSAGNGSRDRVFAGVALPQPQEPSDSIEGAPNSGASRNTRGPATPRTQPCRVLGSLSRTFAILCTQKRSQSYLTSLGAAGTTYGSGMVGRLLAIASGDFHGALDLAGSGVVPELLGLVADPMRVVSIADMNAVAQGARFSSEPVDMRRALEESTRLAAVGSFHIPVARVLVIAQAEEAHRLSAAGYVIGRFVLKVS